MGDPSLPAQAEKVRVIAVDTREPALYALLSSVAESRSLDVGDVELVSADGKRRLVIELKTMPDLAASVVDGRHRSQRARLLALRTTGAAAIAYVIRTPTLGGYPPRAMGALCSLVARFGIPVMRTVSLDETADLVRGLSNQLERDPPDDVAGTLSSYVTQGALVQPCRKRNLGGPVNNWIAMLSTVPGVSAHMASAIAHGGVPSCRALMALAPPDAAALLADIPIPTKKQRDDAGGRAQRRLGRQLADRIMTALCGEQNS
jgi:ERCC4-type nuclease